ncbi:Zinc finger protein 2-like protein [Frankliniella fusca]|uniref:Zinc finger protein 2-like protein n=1 Tax=Frankliniella fusca TaxID=407009 RepID=A0AAE1HI14_9NEOP|nr:Zinc finger protein 2-like protein [Frankliniella fusca]
MPPSRIFCLAKSCYNYQPSPLSPAFFNLPSDLASRVKWVENAGRSDLKEKTVSTLSGKYYICADHFEPSCFFDPSKRTLLRRDVDVVPTIFKSNLASLVTMDDNKSFRDSQSTLAGSVLAEVESAQEILNAAVVSEDVLDGAEWTNIVAVSLGDDGSLMCNTLNSPAQELTEHSVSFTSVNNADSNEMVMECLMLCRLCAALVQVNMLVSIFGNESDQTVKDMIDRIIPGQVLMDDGLPQRICTSCLEKVRSCCEILDSFKAADSRLRQMVELCNLDNSNESLTLQGDGSLPIILQTVDESPEVELTGIDDSITSHFTEDQTSLDGFVPHSLQLNSRNGKQEAPEADFPTSGCIAISDTLDFNVHVEAGDELSFQNSGQIKCGVCHEVFEEPSDLVSHCMNYHSIKIDDGSVFSPDDISNAFQCTICEVILPNSNSLKSHMLSHALGTYECSLCKLNFKEKSELNNHLSQEHGSCHSESKESTEEGREHRCEHCGKVFRSTIALRKHKTTHTGERTVLCSLCGKTLANLNSLRVHMRIHSGERPYACSECGKSFKGPSELRSHSVTHSREKIHNCPECGRKFHSKGLVRQHMLSHTHDKPHKCDMCTASFNRLGNLNQHKKKHVDKTAVPAVTPFECNACGKRFQSKLTLKYHLAKHTGDKYPFDCEICGKKFIAIDPYRVHMRVHTGERPYECEVCKKTFRSSGTLKQHISSLHRDDFPFGCPYCQRSFKRLQSLIVHKKTHTGEKPWLCSQCGRAFAQKGDMIKHTKTHRPNVEEEEIIMEVDTIDDSALVNEISKMIFG